MRSSTAMPKPCLRSRLFFFFLAAILLHPFISSTSPHIFFYFLIFLSLLPRIQMRINIKHLFIAPRNLSLVSLACTAHVLRVDFEFIRSFWCNCHVTIVTHLAFCNIISFAIINRVNQLFLFHEILEKKKKIKISFAHLFILQFAININTLFVQSKHQTYTRFEISFPNCK